MISSLTFIGAYTNRLCVERSASGSLDPEMSLHDRLAKRRASSSRRLGTQTDGIFFSRGEIERRRESIVKRGMVWKKYSIRFALSNRASRRADWIQLKPGVRVTYVDVLANNLRITVLRQLLPVDLLKLKDLNDTFSRFKLTHVLLSVSFSLRSTFSQD